MFVKYIWLWLVALLLLVGVGGCGGSASDSSESGVSDEAPVEQTSESTADAAESDDSESDTTSPYPYPAASTPTIDPAYPSPEQDPTPVGRDPEPVPTPAEDTAVVHGQLYDSATDEPLYNGVTVYLAEVIPTDNPDMDAVSLDRATDPNIVPDREGGFAFADVAPGRYSLVVQGPLNQYVARYADGEQDDVIVTVEAGEAVDLGKLYAGFP
jgi:hypothetical protein